VLQSAGLENYFHRDRVRLESAFFDNVSLPTEAAAYLAEWAKDLDTHQVFCITSQEFLGDELENPMSMLASRFIELAAASRVPVVSYFCELRRKERLRGDNTAEVQALMSLGYGLLRQMIELIPLEFEGANDFTERRFEEFDGTLRTWQDFTNVFREIQGVLPRKVYCVIDGLNWLDDSSTAARLKAFVEILRHDKLKVLFTCSGSSRCLLEKLSREELIILDGRMANSTDLDWCLEEGALY